MRETVVLHALFIVHRPTAIFESCLRQFARLGLPVTIHVDRKARLAKFLEIHARVRTTFLHWSATFVRRRLRCRWGGFGLVEATCRTLEQALKHENSSHFVLLRETCHPIQPLSSVLENIKDLSNSDMIQSLPIDEDRFITWGESLERFVYVYPGIVRSHHYLYRAARKLNQAMGIWRTIPAELTLCIGSQWWLLRRATCVSLMRLIKNRRDLVRFFKFANIPDESFFQTLVRLVVHKNEIDNRSPTFSYFHPDTGKAASLGERELAKLATAGYFFARKCSDFRSTLERLETLTNNETPKDVRRPGQGRFRSHAELLRFAEVNSCLQDQRLLVICGSLPDLALLQDQPSHSVSFVEQLAKKGKGEHLEVAHINPSAPHEDWRRAIKAIHWDLVVCQPVVPFAVLIDLIRMRRELLPEQLRRVRKVLEVMSLDRPTPFLIRAERHQPLDLDRFLVPHLATLLSPTDNRPPAS